MISALSINRLLNVSYGPTSLRLLLHLQCMNHNVYFTGLLREYYIRFKDLCDGTERDDKGQRKGRIQVLTPLLPEARCQQAGTWGPEEGWLLLGSQVWMGRALNACSGLANSNNFQAPGYRVCPLSSGTIRADAWNLRT